jgi:hypothetical protein
MIKMNWILREISQLALPSPLVLIGLIIGQLKVAHHPHQNKFRVDFSIDFTPYSPN